MGGLKTKHRVVRTVLSGNKRKPVVEMKLIRFGCGDGGVDCSAVLHLDSPLGIDYTLCGLSLDDDPKTTGPHEYVQSAAVTCPSCMAIITHCRGVRIKSTKNED